MHLFMTNKETMKKTCVDYVLLLYLNFNYFLMVVKKTIHVITVKKIVFGTLYIEGYGKN